MSISYFRDVLPSGLRVVTVEAPHLHTAFISVYVRTGSRHEEPSNNGVSHFLEHMFFRGSESFPDTVKMNAAVEEVGGNLNGVPPGTMDITSPPSIPTSWRSGFGSWATC